MECLYTISKAAVSDGLIVGGPPCKFEDMVFLAASALASIEGRGSTMKLAPEEDIQNLLRDHPQWKLQQGKLTRDWIFSDFNQAMAFVNQAAALAEQANHHPDIDIRYNRVTLALISHDANGLTSRDLAMVRRIDDQFQNLDSSPEKVL